MKKAITRAILIVMTIVTLATVMPISANASTSNAKKIYNILTSELGFNSAAACGILANIERESDFNPKLVIRDSNGLTSGGLCQWNGGRFSGGDQCNADYIRQVIKAVNAEGIPVRFTYTNPLITEEDLAEIRQLPHVYETTFADHKLTVLCSGGKHNLMRVLEYLQKKEDSFGHVYSTLPSLNDVFLEITGKELRD